MRLDRPLVYVLDPDLATIRTYHIVSISRLLPLILMRRVILRLSVRRMLRKRGMMGDDPQFETPHFAHDAQVGTAIEDRLHNAHH